MAFPTPSQQNAIDIKDKTILVSAAAGSGKTATLTQRIIKRLTKDDPPADISNMLIVTFTRAAAAELKVKIFNALSETLSKLSVNEDEESRKTTAHLASQLTKLSSAKICTIDSFYFDVLKENYTLLENIKSSVRIIDDAEYVILAKNVMSEIIEDFYNASTTFPSLVESLVSIRSMNSAANVFLDIYDKLQTAPEGIEFLKKQSKEIRDASSDRFFNSSYGIFIRQKCVDILEHYITAYESMLDPTTCEDTVREKYGPMLKNDLDFAKAFLLTLKEPSQTYEKVRSDLFAFEFKKLGTISPKTDQSQVATTILFS